MTKKLTIQEAFETTTNFLTSYWKATNSEDIANLLSDMNTDLFLDSLTADPAIWDDWIQSAQKTLGNTHEKLLTAEQAFITMKDFLTNYIPFQEPSDTVTFLMNNLSVNNKAATNSVLWNNWLDSISATLNKQKT